MRKITIKKYKKVLILSLFVLVISLSIGYAAFNTNINLKTKGNIKVTDESCFTVFDNGDGTGTITDYDTSCGLKVKIPSTINNLTITKIGEAKYNGSIYVGAFAYKKLEAVIFPDTLEEIGFSSFSSNNIESIILPDSVKKIDSHAFAWGKLSYIKLNEGLETIGLAAFESNNLKSLSIPSTVKNMYSQIASGNNIEGDDAFIFARDKDGNIDNTYLNCFANRNEEVVNIPNTVKTIGNTAFVSDIYVKIINIPDSVEAIMESAFYSMPLLEKVNIGSGIKEINSNAFNIVPKLKEVNINLPDGAISGSPWGASNATINFLG